MYTTDGVRHDSLDGCCVVSDNLYTYIILRLYISNIYIYIYNIYILRLLFDIWRLTVTLCRSQWPRGLRRRSVAARLLRLWVRIARGAWMSVCCERCMLSGRSLCVGLITRPEESYRLWLSRNLVNEEALAYWGAVAQKNST
jgi:hypothetical protein